MILFPLVLLSLDNTYADGKRGLGIDDLLQLEDIDQVAFSPDGSRLLFERLRPYDTATDYGRSFLRGKDRSGLYVVDPGAPRRIRPLFPQKDGAGYWQGPFAPDSKRIVVFWIDAGRVHTGVFAFETGTLTPFSITPELTFYGPSPIWVSNRELVYVALPDGRQPLWASLQRRAAETLPGLWHRAWQGKTPTASVLESGPSHATGSRPIAGALVRVDAVTGAVSKMDDGIFTGLALAPDHAHLAAFRSRTYARQERESTLLRAHPLLSGLVSELVIYRLDGHAGAPIVCGACQAMIGSLDWSRDGRKLLFLSRSTASDTADARLMLVSPSTGAVKEVAHDGLRPVGEPGWHLGKKLAFWVGNRIALYAVRVGARDSDPACQGKQDAQERADWYLLDSEGCPVNLTASFRSVPRMPLAKAGDAVFLLAEGALWQVTVDGVRRNLTAGITNPLPARPQRTWGLDFREPREVERIALLIAAAQGGQKIIVLDPATQAKVVIGTVGKQDRIKAISTPAGFAVVRRETESDSQLVLLARGAAAAPFLRFNDGLEKVADGKVLRIVYKAGDQQTRTGWLLLPPDAKPGQRRPMITIIYPGATHDGRWPWTKATISPFNPYPLAARGYAVLFPSLPLGPEGEASDPLLGLADSLMPAVDRAIALGYADPERLGIFGQSYGGYGVLGVISQTDRFKAAVASAAPTNLLSKYGQFDARMRLSSNIAVLMGDPRWAEIGQGRMGHPPWRDPDRYLRNSPLFHVERINTPVMLLQGDLDYVSIGQGEEMFTALYRLGKDAIFVRYWGEGHVLTSPANIRDFWRRVFDWYAKYLGHPGRSRSATARKRSVMRMGGD